MISKMWCNHQTTSWPQRGTDGIDYCTCLQCGCRLISTIQFEGSTYLVGSDSGCPVRTWDVRPGQIVGALALVVLIIMGVIL